VGIDWTHHEGTMTNRGEPITSEKDAAADRLCTLNAYEGGLKCLAVNSIQSLLF
jgi:hypothetical protein